MADFDMQQILARDEAEPGILRLWRALGRLRSTLTFMNTGAHPDDEHSGLLAWLRFGRGMRIAIACSTRGEGGQNALGPERGDALGLIRTAEMEAAAQVLDAHIAWLGFGTGDPVHDFGFSKNGEDTLRRWQGDLVIRRLAGSYRAMRPDIVLPTFLDVPGQHGHHRAMTRAAEAALGLAADPGADLGDVYGGDLPVWTVAKFYLPAWSGGGGTYDDEVPPPPETVTINANGREPVTDVPYDRIGEWSRRRHMSQGMGVWPDPPQQSWALHRVRGGAEDDIADGLPADLHQLADLTGTASLADAAGAVDEAIRAFPDGQAVVSPLLKAASALAEAEREISPDLAALHGHRITNKRREVDLAIAEAVGLRCRLMTSSPDCVAGSEVGTKLIAEHDEGVQLEGVTYDTPPGVTATDGRLLISDNAAPTPNFTPIWSPFGDGATLKAEVRANVLGQSISITVPCQPDIRIVPAHTVRVDPASVVLTPYARSANVTLQPLLNISDVTGLSKEPLPDGFRFSWDAGAPPLKSLIELHDKGGTPAYSIQSVALPAGGRVPLVRTASLNVLAVDTARPQGRIGVIAGTDRGIDWLRRLGADVEVVDGAEPRDLSRFDSVLLGVMAMARSTIGPGALRDYVENGGNLVNFYQRPDRGWDADHSGPRFLRVGTPSLRWRVTDPDAAVTVLSPDHPLLRGPNRIGPEDWHGWVKDRGLYFAAEWDPAYQPLLALSDEGEAPLKGALISATIGKGRHTYCALSLAQQMDALVPGAFRLFVNLLAPVSGD